MVSWLVAWRLVGWLVDPLVGCRLADWSVVCFVSWMAAWLISW